MKTIELPRQKYSPKDEQRESLSLKMRLFRSNQRDHKEATTIFWKRSWCWDVGLMARNSKQKDRICWGREKRRPLTLKSLFQITAEKWQWRKIWSNDSDWALQRTHLLGFKAEGLSFLWRRSAVLSLLWRRVQRKNLHFLGKDAFQRFFSTDSGKAYAPCVLSEGRHKARAEAVLKTPSVEPIHV